METSNPKITGRNELTATLPLSINIEAKDLSANLRELIVQKILNKYLNKCEGAKQIIKIDTNPILNNKLSLACVSNIHPSHMYFPYTEALDCECFFITKNEEIKGYLGIEKGEFPKVIVYTNNIYCNADKTQHMELNLSSDIVTVSGCVYKIGDECTVKIENIYSSYTVDKIICDGIIINEVSN